MAASQQLEPTTAGALGEKKIEFLVTATAISLALHVSIGLLVVYFLKGQPALLSPRLPGFSLVTLIGAAPAPKPQHIGALPRSRLAQKPELHSRPRSVLSIEPVTSRMNVEGKSKPMVLSPTPMQEERQQNQPEPSPDASASKTPAPTASVPHDSGSLTNITGEGLAMTSPVYDAAYLSNPVPPYPPAAKRLKLQGTVIVRVLVNADGKPESVNLQKSSGASILDQAAINALKRWSFVPARCGDQAIAAWVDVPVRFHLN